MLVLVFVCSSVCVCVYVCACEAVFPVAVVRASQSRDSSSRAKLSFGSPISQFVVFVCAIAISAEEILYISHTHHLKTNPVPVPLRQDEIVAVVRVFSADHCCRFVGLFR